MLPGGEMAVQKKKQVMFAGAQHLEKGSKHYKVHKPCFACIIPSVNIHTKALGTTPGKNWQNTGRTKKATDMVYMESWVILQMQQTVQKLRCSKLCRRM